MKVLFLLLIAPCTLVHGSECGVKSPITVGNTRFTFYSEHIVRIEQSSTRKFDDRNTLTVTNRGSNSISCTVTHPNSTTTTIKSQYLTINYDSGVAPKSCKGKPGSDVNGGTRCPEYPNGLSDVTQEQCCDTCTQKLKDCVAWIYEPSSKSCWVMSSIDGTRKNKDRVLGSTSILGQLSVEVDIGTFPHITWQPDMVNHGNLNGTRTSLDNDVSWVELDNGFVSTDGWEVIDDTHTARFQTDPSVKVPWFTPNSQDDIDWYFLGYGYDIKPMLREVSELMGKTPIPPQSAFGVWWSLYWPFTQQGFNETVLQGYRDHGLPLNHVVLDMDWHIEPKTKGCQSWGGYTWNKNLWPDPETFKQNLQTPFNGYGWPLRLLLNVHPQTGVDHCQAHYQQFCAAGHYDCTNNQTISCDFTNTTFYNDLFKTYLDSNVGVDYWWTDYGGCGTLGGQNLEWSNYVFQYRDVPGRMGIRRKLVLSRWGGIGNKRNPVGFSGDVHALWTMLAFEIYFTPTAANVLFGYWSHDIGGFHTEMWPDRKEPSELYLRWIQFGSVAPILRTHCNHCERRIWVFEDYLHMKDAMIFRNNLGPYIYTEAHNYYANGLPFIHPMYWVKPSDKASYGLLEQYMFGDNIVVHPIGMPVDNTTGVVNVDTYLPMEGDSWFAWKCYNGTEKGGLFKSGTIVKSQHGKSDFPIFVKEGVAIPMKTMDSVQTNFPDPMMWVLWVAPHSNQMSSGTGVLYEDDGDTQNYIMSNNYHTLTNLHYTIGSSSIQIQVSGIASHPWQRPTRSWQFQIRGGVQPKSVTFGAATVVPFESHPYPTDGTKTWWSYIENDNLSYQGGAVFIQVDGKAHPYTKQLVVNVSF